MTDTPPDDTSSPLPWLSIATPDGAMPKLSTGRQIWSPPTASLVVSYPFVRREFFRDVTEAYRKNARVLVLGMTGLGFGLGAIPLFIAVLMSHSALSSSRAMPASVWSWGLKFWVGATILFPLFLLLFSFLLLAFVVELLGWTAKKKKMRFFVTLTPDGADLKFERSVKLRWEEIKEIETGESGLIFVASYGKPQIRISRSAFADADAVAQFLQAANILWKSGGDMGQVPEETRARFAPTA